MISKNFGILIHFIVGVLRSSLLVFNPGKLVLLFLLFSSTSVHALVTPTFNSSDGPTLLSGGSADLTVGAKYIYQNVATSTDGILVDAIVTIVAINNSSIRGGTIDNLLGVDDRFEPLTNTSSADGYVEWNVEFVQDGTVTNATDTGVRAYLNSFTLEAIDVDGWEYFEVIVTNSYTLEGGNNPSTELTVSTNGAYTKFQSGADAANNIDIANTEYIVRINYENVNSITFRNGSAVNSSDRQNSMSFTGEVNFDSEDTTVLNVAPVVVANTGNTVEMNSSFNVNLLTGASDADGNMDLSTTQLIDPTDFGNLGSVGNPLVIAGVGTYSVDATGNLTFTPVKNYTGGANILFTVSDLLTVSSDRASMGLTVADTTAPAVAITNAPTASQANQNAYPVSGSCTAGDGDVTVSIAGAAPASQDVTCSGGGSWNASFDVTAIADGTDVLTIIASQTDSAGNTGNASPFVADKDSSAPIVVTTSAPLATSVNQAAYPVSGTCSTGDGNVTVNIPGATPASQAVPCNAGTWNAVFDVSAIADGIDVIAINASQTDTAGNTGDAALVEADKNTAPPIVVITSAPTATQANQAAYPVSGTCTAGDGNVSVSIAGATPVSQDIACSAEGSWSASFDVSAIADGTNVIDINASQTDAVGNTGNAVLVEADKDTVTVTITILNAPSQTTGAYTVTFEFSTDVTGFVVGDIVVGNGSAGNFVSVDGHTYTADITPDGNGDISIDVLANVAQDASSNGNTAATQVVTRLTTDADSDGIPDDVECPAGPPFNASCPDSDGDGFPDFQDLDSDNDGIPDRVEAAGNLNNPPDSDNDGTPDHLDLDSDNDGIPDHVEAGADVNNPVDTDGDGTPDYLDLDSDNDGIPDAVEGGSSGLDTDNDGIDDAYDVDQTGGADANADGIDDNAAVDTDADGTVDFRDLDSDNDGIPDAIEGGASGTDTDGDGIDDAYDVDQTGGTDNNGDGIDDNAAVDTDGDGIPDAQDSDSDNDGISDAIEGGAAGTDTDGDGIDDAYDVDQTGGSDANGDGIDDNAVIDTDGDGILNTQDMDSDNDGIPDAVEGVSTNIDTDGDGIPDILENGSSGVDSDSDGIDDILDVDQTGGVDANGDGIDDGVIDRDGDGIANYLDLDSDNDGIPDMFEARSSGVDSNGNNIDDAFDFALVGGVDTNMDGIVDTLLDTDSDAIADVFDLDADADGINDLQESGLSPAKISSLDGDNNGVIETAVGTNGLADAIETNDSLSALLDQDGNGSADSPMDTDSDSRPDFQDLDADNDGIHDLVEGSGFDPAAVDTNNDGVVDDNGTDADYDGIPDSIDSNDSLFGGLANDPVDTDGDLVADFRDLDTDNDGISDLIEGSGLEPAVVDSDNNGVLDNPQIDSDNDGIPDSGDSFAGYGDSQATGPVDTDGDGVADFRDLDADNDSIADVTEAGNQDDNADGFLDPAGTVTVPPLDMDSDGTPDYLDLDSNNDGTLDIDDAGNGMLDSNDDGMLDDATDVDADGIADSIDGDTSVPGLKADKDNDGISDSIDIDDDNDGIPDSAEADGNGNDVDTDGDGLIDRLDHDSDNDGLPDSVEAVQSVLDANADGVVDNFTDANNDGLHDAVDPAMIPLDSDGDSTPDFRDLDSDNDSLNDVFEAAGLSNAFDANDDGRLDILTDADLDGLADIVDPDVVVGTAGTVLPNPDTDSDSLSNYRDTDSDNDGVADSAELIDANGDGIPDAIQQGDELETAVRGIGGFSPLTLLMLFLPLLFKAGKKIGRLHGAAVLVLISGFMPVYADDINFCGRHNPLDSEDDAEFDKCLYIGASWLASTHVDPEGSAFGWSTSDDSDAGYNLFVGWHFKPRWFGELSYADLGEAGLNNSNPSITGTEKISYKIPALHVGYYLFEPEEPFNVYGKLGVSAISNKATTPNVPFDKQNSSGISAGAGVQWRSLSNGLFARLALDFYDKDARSIGLTLGYYFGDSEQSKPVPVAADSDNDGVKDSLDACPDSAAGAQVDSSGCVITSIVEPVVAEVDSDDDGVLDSIDACPDSQKGVQVDATGCVVLAVKALNLTLEGVHFDTNSARLTTDSKIILDKAVEALNSSPLIRVEVQAHTDSHGSEGNNLKLSDRRAASVREYLVIKGIAADRLISRGYGESSPKATNETAEGRARNRRVEFRILNGQQDN